MDEDDSQVSYEQSKQNESISIKKLSPFNSNAKKKAKVNTKAIEEYRKLCNKTYSSPNPSFVSVLKTESLNLYLSTYNLKEINCINRIIGKYYYFNEIALAMDNPQKGDSLEKKKRISSSSSTKSLLTPSQIEKEKKDQKEQQLAKQQKIYNIVQGISKNLCLSDSVIKLTLFGLTLTAELTSFISEGLVANKTLIVFTVSNCQISIDAYEILLKGLLTHESISHLDLSGNGFNDKYANMISRIIARQTQRRDAVIWSYGLRNEKPFNNDYTRGLVSLNLSENQFADIAADSISNALSYDQYVRSVDLSGNLFSKESCKKFIRMLRQNTSILNLDMKDNIGYDPEIHARIVMKMSKNIQHLNQQVIDNEYTVEEFNEMKQFINLSFFNVDIPDEVIDMYNNRLSYSNQDVSAHKPGPPFEEKKQSGDNEHEAEQVTDSNNDVTYLRAKNRKLSDENIILKKELIEMRAMKIQREISKNMDDKESNTRFPQIQSNYNRIVDLLSELTDLMNNVETSMKKEEKNKKQKQPTTKSKEQSNANALKIKTEEEKKEETIGEESEEKEIASSKRIAEEPKPIKDKEKEKEKVKVIEQVSLPPPKEIKVEDKKVLKDKKPQYNKLNYEEKDEEEEEDEEYLDEEDMRHIYNNPYAQQYIMYDDGDYDDEDNAPFQKKINKSF